MTHTQNPLSYEAPSYAGSLTKRQLEIIAKASQLLSRQGAGGLTTKNLAREMNFSEAALYRHFNSKEKIIVTLLDFITYQLDTLFSKMDKNLPTAEKYVLFFDTLFVFFQEERELTPVVFADGLFEKTQATVVALNGISSVLQKHLIPIVMDGKVSSDFPMTINADRIVHILLGTFRFHMQKWSDSRHTFDAVKTGNDLMLTLLHLFKK